MDDIGSQKAIDLETNSMPTATVLDPNRLLWFASALILLCVMPRLGMRGVRPICFSRAG
jgi:hypothetical protein